MYVDAGLPLPSSQDTVLSNGIVAVTISASTGRTSSFANLATGVSGPLVQDWAFYRASVGNKQDGQASGAYIFRPNTSDTFPVNGEQPAGG
jgi:hypothetical protein